MTTRRIRIWDLPTRVFHWALVLLVLAAYLTGEEGGEWIVWHGRIGLAIVGLVVFRLVWGLIGSPTARFAHFVPTPARIRSYLAGTWRGLGHNPLGACSVLALLALLGLQFSTGLFANDDASFRGPLADLVGSSLSDWLTRWHHKVFDALMIFIGLHIAAIVFYALVKKDNLVKPMVHGWKDVPAELAADADEARGALAGGVAFVVALVIALAAVYGASGAWLPAPPPPPPAAAPAAW